MPEAGSLIGIARRDASKAPMEEIESGIITLEAGLEGDHKGRKFKNRAITILSREAWQAALDELGRADLAGTEGIVDLPWTTRRANLLVEGIELPKARGGLIRVGPVLLEVTYPTQPCRRMDQAYKGLLKALHPDWRGGVTCRVLAGGGIMLGDQVVVEFNPGDEVAPRLP